MNFDPQAGHEQSGQRPALVLSPADYHDKAHLAVMCPITSKRKGYPFEVPIPPGCPVEGVVLADQIKSLDLDARLVNVIGQAPGEVIQRVLELIAVLLDLPPQFRQSSRESAVRVGFWALFM